MVKVLEERLKDEEVDIKELSFEVFKDILIHKSDMIILNIDEVLNSLCNVFSFTKKVRRILYLMLK
jgi:hypothetical protein